jgi:hypothetical protein
MFIIFVSSPIGLLQLADRLGDKWKTHSTSKVLEAARESASVGSSVNLCMFTSHVSWIWQTVVLLTSSHRLDQNNDNTLHIGTTSPLDYVRRVATTEKYCP